MTYPYKSNRSEWLIYDARMQLEALDVEPNTLKDGMVHATDRPRAIRFLGDQIKDIDLIRPFGLWDHADKFRKLKAEFESLVEKEKTRPRWVPPR